MGYHDGEAQYPLEVFLISGDAEHEAFLEADMSMNTEGRGTPVHDLAGLESVHDDLRARTLVRLQYDRFSPGIARRRGH
ncbi:MAG TPA: hypothetical protein PLS90_00485 [Candidatus Sumerlaeota bacterium]|nr:MAG: hypothetical protein BWZ08_01997 [candidate division BRC1 bacterium ADurb.BinA292]HOE96849.1 hypothetical protein [Candidatus Sumerlaeota bacterium]HOR28574.1 hypothetical protein [Candidatus Sumerlaeota bacterium]HPK00908.1 hypothetical protein [Candidatus Sumerlaeota bacterium]